MAHSMAQMEKPETRGRKKLNHLRIYPMKGGVMVTHHAEAPYGGHEETPYKKEIFTDCEAAMEHIAKHAKLGAPAGAKDEAAEAEEHKMAESADEEDA